MYNKCFIECGELNQDTSGSGSSSSSSCLRLTTPVTARKRCSFQWHACMFSVMIAFFLGIALGIFVPMIGDQSTAQTDVQLDDATTSIKVNLSLSYQQRQRLNFVKFVRNHNRLTTNHLSKDVNGKRKNNFSSTNSTTDDKLSTKVDEKISSKTTPATTTTKTTEHNELFGIITDNIYWSETVERALPHGFHFNETEEWREYIKSSSVQRLETGCGRMQNRLVIFQDNQRACARYRQNTDQIQGELFSFYLGQLMNLSNIAPSAAILVDISSTTWQSANRDISIAQWKSLKPVILTKWLPNLESAGIPIPFQSLERHLNKLDVINITQEIMHLPKYSKELLKTIQPADLSQLTIDRFVELAQWSDLIVFDYLIANLDRVVNNLYNYQWNSDMMSAPAHNLARLKNSQLLVFLDNESGLLHGYRLLKKYEAYHNLLLDNLCIFRQPTIAALKQLRHLGVGRELQKLFDNTTSQQVRDILPSLPNKSIKILTDRIDRVLSQVQKCAELFTTL